MNRILSIRLLAPQLAGIGSQRKPFIPALFHILDDVTCCANTSQEQLI